MAFHESLRSADSPRADVPLYVSNARTARSRRSWALALANCKTWTPVRERAAQGGPFPWWIQPPPSGGRRLVGDTLAKGVALVVVRAVLVLERVPVGGALGPAGLRSVDDVLLL